MNKYYKEKNGITLIALVITIVILIILSTITINMAFGEGRNNTKSGTNKRRYRRFSIRTN